MNKLFEGLKQKGALVFVPSSAVDAMNLGSMSRLAALGFGQVNNNIDTSVSVDEK
jgi:hypothetical protein